MANIKTQEQKHQEYVNKITIKYDGNIIVIGQFINLITPIEHYCIKHNNNFDASPNTMLYSKTRKGCLECSGYERWTYLRLVTELALICFPDGTPKFLLITSEDDFNRNYKNTTSKCIRLRCTKDGYEWDTTIHNLINSRRGCSRCSGQEEWTYLRLVTTLALICFPDGTPRFILLTSEKYFYKNFEGVKTRIRLRCTLDGYEWETSINNLINGGTGCARCSGHEEWTYLRLQVAISELRYPDGSPVCTLEMSEADFLKAYKKDGVNTKIPVRCAVNRDHTWSPRLTSLIYSGSRCPHCKATGYSKSEIEWLEFVMADERIYIQHAKNGGQVNICGRFVDGMCYETNSVFQFHGDYWHGNPDIHDPDFVNQVNYKRMGDLYEETLIKDQELRDEGYNVVIMWESEWKEIKKKLNK